MTVVHQLPGVSVASTKDSSNSRLVELPLVHILGNVLTVRSQRIPHINAHKVAVQIQKRDIEIDANLRLRVLVNGDARFDGSSRERQRFTEEQNSHDENGCDAHKGTQSRGLRMVMGETVMSEEDSR